MISTNHPTAVFMSITPEMAAEMLESNTENFRNISDSRVTTMSKDMSDGNWELNGETIKVHADGKVLDGQHRLWAIVKSGVTIQALVVQGLHCEGKSIDRGQSRTVGQWLAHTGVPSAGRVAAIARSILCYEGGQWGKSHMNNLTLTDSDVIDFAEVNLKAIQDAMAVVKQQGFFSLPLRATIAFVASGENMPSQCPTIEWFFETLKTGVGLTELDAVFHLRNRWIKQTPGSKLTPFMQRALITEAWNRTAEGVETTQRMLTFRFTGPSAQKAPSVINPSPDIRSAEIIPSKIISSVIPTN